MDRRTRMTPRELERMLFDETTEPKALPLSLLEEITDGFSDDKRIGSGAFAVVYKGNLENSIVAVKRMSNTYMYEKEFQREVQCLMMVKNINVVRFLGYCADTQGTVEKLEGKFIMADVQQRLLCFEYLPKGSLHDYITDTSTGLRWRHRYQIINGIIHGLHYLHQNNIVHLDLKPGNILLDGNLVAKIADFGLSRCFDEMQSRVVTNNIGGTLGYLAPEFYNGEISYKFDIYSLGVILIEILTGKKGYHDVDKVVKSWSNRLEEPQREKQLEQVRVCAQIGMECTDFNPARRPNTQHIISILDNTKIMDDYVETGGIQNFPDMLDETMYSLWVSYQKLNPDIKRCMQFCSIFPKGYKLRMAELVRLWIAQGFVKTSSSTEEMEDVAGGYVQELVSYSFLQPEETVVSYSFCDAEETTCFTIHDLLHDLLDKVAGNDFFRIENAMRESGEGWREDVHRDVRHLFVEYYDAELITEKKILGLENLHTLIFDVVEDDRLVEEEVIESICKRLPKLKVLAVAFSREHYPIRQSDVSVPGSIGQLKDLRYFACRTKFDRKVTLPSTLNKLEHIQVLDFCDANILEFPFAGLITLQHILCSGLKSAPIGRLISLQTARCFQVSNAPGCGLNQLRDLNKLRGQLDISGLENIRSKEDNIYANLAAKERVTILSLEWHPSDGTRYGTPEDEAEVLESLCPPVGLEELHIYYYKGSRYPDWMVGKKKCGDLQKLRFWGWQLRHAPELVEAFPRLRELSFRNCSLDALPRNMEHLTSLKTLEINSCMNIRSLPTLPQSLEKFKLWRCNELKKSCQTVGHANWQKIQHIPIKEIRFY